MVIPGEARRRVGDRKNLGDQQKQVLRWGGVGV